MNLLIIPVHFEEVPSINARQQFIQIIWKYTDLNGDITMLRLLMSTYFLSTYDFSTLCTTLPYKLIKGKLLDLIGKTFLRANSL